MPTVYTKALLSERLGEELDRWEFLGQCYKASIESNVQCAITLRPTQHCYILKKKDHSKGKAIVGHEAFPHIQRWAPKLHEQLMKGREWHTLHRKAVVRDASSREGVERLAVAEKAWRTLSMTALRRADTIQQRLGTDEIPEPVVALAAVASKTPLPFKLTYHRARWYEGQVAQLRELLDETEDLIPTRKTHKKHVPVEVVVPATAAEIPVPPTSEVLLGTDIEFEDIFQ
jgi:hypothetical protein